MSHAPFVVIFADEWGIPLVLNSLPDNINVCLVVDSNRHIQLSEDVVGDFYIVTHPNIAEREQFVAKLARRQPLLGVIASYGRILWPELINIFPNGVINLHGGKLPEYRGANVLQWAIINGEKEAGIFLHYVDEGIDTGNIIDQSAVPICFQDTAVDVRDNLNKEGRRLLTKWLPKLIEKKIDGEKQSEAKAKYWPRRKPDEGCFDWSWSNERIYNLIRALVNPWPGAFFIDRNGRKVVFDSLKTIEEIEVLRKDNF